MLCLTRAGADFVVRKKACPRRHLASSATSAAALISTTPRTARPRRRCWRSLHTPHTTAAGGRSGPTATPARCLGTGQLTAMTTRPSDTARGRGRPLCVPIGHFTQPAFLCAECQDRGWCFLTPSLSFPLPIHFRVRKLINIFLLR